MELVVKWNSFGKSAARSVHTCGLVCSGGAWWMRYSAEATGWWLVGRREDFVSQRTSTVLGLMWRVDELGQASMVLRGHIFPTI